MAMLTGILVILVFWALASLGVIVGSVLLLARISGPKRPKRQDPPTPPGLREFYEEPRAPAPKPRTPLNPQPTNPRPSSPSYLRRWGLYRRHSVAAEKAQWDEEFNRLLR